MNVSCARCLSPELDCRCAAPFVPMVDFGTVPPAKHDYVAGVLLELAEKRKREGDCSSCARWEARVKEVEARNAKARDVLEGKV
jgi:hypothetical protein